MRDGGAANAAAPVPRPGSTPGCCMQDDEDGAGSVAAPSARSREAEPRPRDGAGPRCPLDLEPPPLRLARGVHVNGVLPCGSLHRAVRPSVCGFLCNGTLCGGARQATPSRRRARGAAQWPPSRCSAVLHQRAVGPLPVTDVAPLKAPLPPSFVSGPGAPPELLCPAAAPRAWSRNTRPPGRSCDRG